MNSMVTMQYQACCKQWLAKQKKTKAIYMPIIDKTPSDPDTIKSALKQAQTVASRTGQEYTAFTGDLRLYKVALNSIWPDPVQYNSILLRLDGMHTLMSFICSVIVVWELMERDAIKSTLKQFQNSCF